MKLSLFCLLLALCIIPGCCWGPTLYRCTINPQTTRNDNYENEEDFEFAEDDEDDFEEDFE